jgi:hypothetical protein
MKTPIPVTLTLDKRICQLLVELAALECKSASEVVTLALNKLGGDVHMIVPEDVNEEETPYEIYE